MYLSILSNKDIEELKRIGNELQKGNKTEQKLAADILRYVKNRRENPFLGKSEQGRPMFPDSEAADDSLAH